MTKPKLDANTKFHLARMDKLVGKTIARAVVDGSEPPFIGLQFADRTIAWILCDEEGNGPGALDIQEPEKK